MRSKLYQLAFLVLFLSSFSLVIKYYQGNEPTLNPAKVLPQEYDIHYSISEPIKTLDPAEANNLSEAKIIVNMFEGLVRYKPNSTEIEPCLATHWEVSPDGRSWTFFLRQDVQFHDQTPFNAEAVKFTVERQKQPLKKDTMTYGNYTFGLVASVEIVDDYTVRFNLIAPYAPLLRNLAMPWSAPIVSPSAVAKLGDRFAREPVGTGPYHLAGWDKDAPILVANDSYWGGIPRIKSVIFSYETLENRLNSFNSGQADMIDIPPHLEHRLVRENKMLLSQPSGSLGYLGMYNNKPPFNNARVRRALCMAINREEIAKALYGNSNLAANSVLPPQILGYSKDLKPYTGGPAKAKELLKSLGYPNGLDITLINYNSPRPYNPQGGTVLAELIKEQLSKAGVRVTVKSYPWHEFKSALNKEEGNIFLFGWTGDNMDPDNFLYSLFSSSGIPNTNLTRYKNSEVDRLISAAQVESDENLRKRLYFHAQQIILQDTPAVFLNYGLDTLVICDFIQGIKLNPYGLPVLAGATIKR